MIKEMAWGKSPGSDGFGLGIYIVFFNKIKQLLVEMFNYAFQTGNLHASVQYGLITLILKKDRDLNWVKNWRPIVLLNTDYKILSKMIANRLKVILPDIINLDQIGFTKGRSVSDNLHKILDVIDFTDLENIPALFISVYFEKAFDRVHYMALYKTLAWFGFEKEFIKWVEFLFNSFKLVTVNNGYASGEIRPSRGLYQENPIAPYLFLV